MAVVREGEVLIEASGDPRLTHGQRLPGELRQALQATDLDIAGVELLAVAAGPGSFTGLRVGIACMQGLAFARDLKIVPVSTLEALSRHPQVPGGALVAPWVDAQRGEVFAALYDSSSAEVVAPTSAPPDATLAAWRSAIASRPVVFIGDGAVRYRAAIGDALGDLAIVVEPAPMLAGTIGRIAALEPHRAVLPHAVVPIYVRRPDAELARDRRRAPSKTT